MVTSNLGFADWTQVFGDERLTAALLDRLTHRSHILEFVGESYRFQQRMRKQEHLIAAKTSPSAPISGLKFPIRTSVWAEMSRDSKKIDVQTTGGI